MLVYRGFVQWKVIGTDFPVPVLKHGDLEDANGSWSSEVCSESK